MKILLRNLILLISFLVILQSISALSCEGCFYECLAYLEKVKDLEEPEKSIALALWFGEFSAFPNENCHFRDPSEWGNHQRTNKRIARYYNLYNGLVIHTHNTREDRISHNYGSDIFKKLEIPLLTRDNTIFINILLKSNSNDSPLCNYSLKNLLFMNPENVSDIPRQIAITLFSMEINTIGGKMEAGWGFDLKSEPIEIMSGKIELSEDNSYKFDISEILNRIEKFNIKGPPNTWTSVIMKTQVLEYRDTISGTQDNGRISTSLIMEVGPKPNEMNLKE